MTDVLARLCADKRRRVATARAQKPLAALEAEAEAAPPPRGFADALTGAGDIGLIAEIKKASPSKGLIRADFDPPALARAYEEGGATCLSVLTEETRFQGKNADLAAARAACSLPVLRKDFMVDPWQAAESRALGADCVLIIMAAVDDETAVALAREAERFGMDCLIEVHDGDELARALALPGD